MSRTSPPLTSPDAGDTLPLLRLGFRPFYLLAALSATIQMALWVVLRTGLADLPNGTDARFWHMHEMVFGFSGAVIVGFLFTAGRSWTGLATPTGAPLAAFAMLWLSARVASVSASYPVYFLLDVAFLPLVAAVFGDLIVRARSWRNLGVVAILAGLGTLNLVAHLAHSGLIDTSVDTPLLGGVMLVIVLQSVIVGRIFPAFTMNALPHVRIAADPHLDRSTVGATLAAALAWLSNPQGRLAFALLAIAAVLHAWRVVRWQPWVTLRTPVIWVLHLSYAWVPLGLALLAASAAGIVARSVGVHALTVGAIGGLVFAMMTRTARGHTGRPQVAGRFEVLAYHAILGAAVLRVGLPLVNPALHGLAVASSALLWITAFATYLVIYTPWLTRPRLDGREG